MAKNTKRTRRVIRRIGRGIRVLLPVASLVFGLANVPTEQVAARRGVLPPVPRA